MFDLGMQELIVIFIVALIVFGPKKLPELGRTIGKGISELRRSMSGIKEQFDGEIKDVKEKIDEEVSSLKVESLIDKSQLDLSLDDEKEEQEKKDVQQGDKEKEVDG